ncbi:MAG: carboxypeptidase regulatory-like domain-containing protein [Saprospiraceae bacterium]|nr:carboxypeptidase regulatory-like domain-containing protein [Saprospiraceae bacterium]
MKRVLSLPSILLLVAGALFWFPACDLGLDGAVHRKPPAGRVIETGTGAPIPGARVILSDCDGEFLGNSNCVILDSTLSDASGNYAFTRWGFMVNAQKEGYFTDDHTSALVLDGSEETTDIVLPPYAWLEVTVRNESGAFAISVPGPSETHSSMLMALPENADTVYWCLYRGNVEHRFIYGVLTSPEQSTTDPNASTVKINGVVIQPMANTVATWVDFYLPGHDTTKITIAY